MTKQDIYIIEASNIEDTFYYGISIESHNWIRKNGLPSIDVIEDNNKILKLPDGSEFVALNGQHLLNIMQTYPIYNIVGTLDYNLE